MWEYLMKEQLVLFSRQDVHSGNTGECLYKDNECSITILAVGAAVRNRIQQASFFNCLTLGDSVRLSTPLSCLRPCILYCSWSSRH